MKLLRYVSFATLALGLVMGPASAMYRPAVDEVLKLKNAGVGEESILAFVQRGNVDYALTADDLVSLKNQGVSSAVLAAMVQSGAGNSPGLSPANAPAMAPPPATAPAPGPAPVTAMSAVPNVTVAPPGMSPDVSYFYQQLSPYGTWILTEDNQWSWRPAVVAANRDWRPYWDQGHWLYTDSGWYWASDYSWGWAPFHYGRWRLHPMHGWIWQPDTVWGPAWVTWRSGGDYCGWAPLPPGTSFDVGGALVFRGRRVSVDFDFGLDWHHFNFCRVREMGDARRPAFRRDEERRSVFGRTTVIVNNYSTRMAVIENRPQVRVYNRGVDPGRVASLRGRAVETVTIHDLRAPAPKGRHEQFDKKSKTIEVYRPRWGDQDSRRHN